MVIIAISSLISILFVPWNVILLCIVFLAAIGKSLGVRKLFIKTLITVFEYGRRNIEDATKHKRIIAKDSDDEGYEEGLPSRDEDDVIIERSSVSTEPPLISREKQLILVPNLAPNAGSEQNGLTEGTINFDMKHWLLSLDYTKSGIESIIEDQVTSRFEAQELKNWNFLTRTNRSYEFISLKLTLLWIVGFLVRYLLLLPVRAYIFIFGLTWLSVTTALVGHLPESGTKRWLNHRCYVIAFRILTRSLSAVINIHNKQWRPQKGSICVANHTSPIDCVILSNDNCYSLIGQRHDGILGMIQTALHRASPHIWFERSETRDRSSVLKRLKEHTSDSKNPPMLIFPEGTCINNTSVMQFKKGSFEVGCPIYPVAIKYDPRFGDAFWNSSKYSMLQYLFMMITSWAIVCDVWYLPPVQQKDHENSVEYANRVKHLIAQQGGLVDLVWDGQLKRSKPKKEWMEEQQHKISKVWKAE
ncbi:glycerol-3-phosphate acyltransferase 3-like [Euwallacea fornicatus]|uniref:glycerol-3-phosphate acyltransferase 3-like n=1 Tax=Euwallacea fornicatus TaxID=995702 RepID=UPI00339064B2